MSNNSEPTLDENQIEDISEKVVWRVSRVAGQYRREFAQEVARDLHSRVTLETNAQVRIPTPAQACPAPPICASGTDEHVLGMNQVVSGTIGSSVIGPRSQDWKFSARVGDQVVFRMKKKSRGLDPLLTLSDEQGNMLASNDDIAWVWNMDAALRYRFVHNGIYILRCMPAPSHSSGEGSYTLSATRVSAPR